MNSSYSAIVGFVFIIAIGFTGWFMVREEAPVYHSKTELDHTRDIYMQNILATRYDTQGHIASQLKTIGLDHYPHDNTSLITRPRITIHRDDNSAPWRIHANHGKAVNGIDDITLWGNVVIHQASSANNQATTFRTARLHYFPKQKLAKTDQAIHVWQPGLTVDAIGMIANLDTNHVKLLKQTRVHYDKHV